MCVCLGEAWSRIILQVCVCVCVCVCVSFYLSVCLSVRLSVYMCEPSRNKKHVRPTSLEFFARIFCYSTGIFCYITGIFRCGGGVWQWKKLQYCCNVLLYLHGIFQISIWNFAKIPYSKFQRNFLLCWGGLAVEETAVHARPSS